MRKKLLCLVAGLLVVATAAPASAGTVAVSITRVGFVPEMVDIRPGDTVTWTNADTQNHQVVSQEAGFSSPVLQPGQTYSFTFRRAGTFRYEDPLVRPRLRGTVRVTAPDATLTITAQPRVLTYGRSTVLTGMLSNQRSGERVSVFAQACGGSFARVGEATTTAGGAWTLTVKPLNNTVYRAQWKNAESAPVTVKVRPRLVLGRVAPRTFSLRVFASTSFAGKAAVFQRYNRTLRRWVRVRYVTLRASDIGVSPTVVSVARFRARVRAGLRVRAVLGQSQVGSCYLTGRSNVVRA